MLSWLARIESAGVSQVSLLVTAAEFGSMSTVLIDLLSDRLDQPVALLRSDNLEAATVAEEAAKLADAAAKAVGRVGEVPYLSYDLPAGRLRIPEGRTEQAADARKRLAEELYAALDSPFRRFFVELTSYDDVQDARRPWAETVEQAARAIVDRQMSQLTSAQAFAGADRESWFSRELSKACSQFTGENAITKGAR